VNSNSLPNKIFSFTVAFMMKGSYSTYAIDPLMIRSPDVIDVSHRIELRREVFPLPVAPIINKHFELFNSKLMFSNRG
jgi:hypothetical protein